KIARAVAETAERAARVAIERAVDVASRLEQISSGRHLNQELAQTQSEADQATAIAEQAQHIAEEEILSTLEEMAQEEQEAIVHSAAMPDEALSDTALLQEAQLLVDESFENSGSYEEIEDIVEIGDMEGVEDLGEIEGIAEITEEEDMVQAITARLIADAAAAVAAEAEALAEASSARTREARRYAADADRALVEVRATIRNGAISEDEARIQLHFAEHEATRAHAMLADAEAAEEEAINTARNAEAEAEVAEGMAFAATTIAEDQLQTDVTIVLTGENISPTHEDNADDSEDAHSGGNANGTLDAKDVMDSNDADITTKIRKFYPRQPM
ncbi:MAG TPA: hypothetical protein VKR42_08290, partial [Ktedonobacteraceae bacterium]|nr:hypothetical protein [Ktedonobacteraceae bacterium]